MTNNEINKIIAEYMNLEIEFDEKIEQYITPSRDRWWSPVMFCNSLDSLVPVWEKLGDVGFNMNFSKRKIDSLWEAHTNECMIRGWWIRCETIQQAAARATAKVIQELTK